MIAKDFIYIDPDGYKIRMLSLSTSKPKRLLLVPSLVGANGLWAIKTFRSFIRKDCLLIAFDYCGHNKKVGNSFTLDGTFKDTKAALAYVLEYSQKTALPVHVAGACFGLIPLIHSLNSLGWPNQIRSIFGVNGLLSINDVLKFDQYLKYLKKRGVSFKNKTDFIKFLKDNKDEFVKDKKIYIESLTEYLSTLFTELAEIISSNNFGILEYLNVDFYTTFYEFMIIDLPIIKIPVSLPSLFFAGQEDTIIDMKKLNAKYSFKIFRIAPHAVISNLNVDHFGRGKEHWRITDEAVKFMISKE